MANSAQGHKVLRHSGRRQTESARREIKVYLAGRNNPTPHACNPSSSSTASSNVRLPDYLPITFLQVCLEILFISTSTFSAGFGSTPTTTCSSKVTAVTRVCRMHAPLENLHAGHDSSKPGSRFTQEVAFISLILAKFLQSGNEILSGTKQKKERKKSVGQETSA